MQQKVLYPIIAALLAVGISALLISTAEPVAGDKEARVAVSVSAMRVTAETLQLKVHSQGSIEPRVQSALIPEVSGVVAWVSPALVAGGRIEKDQALLRIEQADYESQISSAKAELARAESRLRQTKQEYQRIRKLQQQKLASPAQLENSESNYQVAKATFGEAEALLAKAERDLARTTIKAPYSGLVRSETIDVGQFIGRGQTIATVYATDYAEVRLPIADSQLAFLDLDGIKQGTVTPGAVLKTRFAGRERQWPAEIVRVEAQIDEQSRMLNAVARLMPDAEASVPVGLFVKAVINGIQRDKLFSLPRSALRGEQQVLLVRDGRLQRQQVNVLRLENQRVIIDGGLNDGDIVCISRNQALAHGTEVRADIQP